MVTRPRLGAVILVACLAVVTEGIGLVGQSAWDSAADDLAAGTEEGAKRLLGDWRTALPPAVLRSRRLVAGELAAFDPDLAVAVLGRLAQRQINAMPAYPEGFLNRARGRLIGGSLLDGRGDLEAALDRDPTRPFALRLMGLITLLQGRWEEGLDWVAEAEAVAPGYRVPPIELSRWDEERIRLEGLERRLVAYPRLKVETLISLGQSLRAMGRKAEAVEKLDLAGGDPRAELVRGQWMLADEDAGEAAGLAEGLVQQKRLPSSVRASAWSLLARSLATQGDFGGAEAAAARALRLAPDSADPHLALARIAIRRGEVDEAVKHYRRAWGMDPSNLQILFEFAHAAERAGEIADARLALTRAVELEPDETGPVLRLVDFQIRNGDFMDAAISLSRALDRHPADPDLLKMGDRLRRAVDRAE